MGAPATIDDLGVEGAADLLALLTAQRRRRNVSPTRRMSIATLTGLAAQGILEMAPADVDVSDDPTFQCTPLEGFFWRYRWDAYPVAELADALVDYLAAIPWTEEGLAIRVRRWDQLAEAEVESFMGLHLARSRFEAGWATDARFLYAEMRPALTIAQWRYCCWAAVRQGAHIVSREVLPGDSLRQRIFEEMARRAGAVACGRWNTEGFPPREGEPRSAATVIFASILTRLGAQFYTRLVSSETVALRDPLP